MSIPKLVRSISLAALALSALVAYAGRVDAKGGSGGGGDAGQNVYVDGNCTVSGTGYTGYNKSGDKVTFMFGVHNDESIAGWHVVVNDAGRLLVDQTVPPMGSEWSMIRTYTSPKGQRLVQVVADAIDGSNHCETWLAYKA